MPAIDVLNWQKEKVRSLDLQLFDYPVKPHLIYEAVCAYTAAGRAGTHKTKNRSEVSGGTRKIWKQKHTGRARMGDNRSPLWRHGGNVHGPVPRDYTWAFPKRMRRNALRSALAQKFQDGKIVCVDSFVLDSPRTRVFEQAVRERLGIQTKVLFLPLEDERNLSLAARNNPRMKVVRALGAGIVDILNHDAVVISEAALLRLNEVLVP